MSILQVCRICMCRCFSAALLTFGSGVLRFDASVPLRRKGSRAAWGGGGPGGGVGVGPRNSFRVLKGLGKSLYVLGDGLGCRVLSLVQRRC